MRHAWFSVLAIAMACSPRDEDVLTLNEMTDTDRPPADADDSNPSLCTFADVALCDGFETVSVQSPPWFFVNQAASVTLDDAHVYRGKQALHIRAEREPDATGVRQGELTETLVGGMAAKYARFFAYVPSPTPPRSFRMAGALQADAPNQGPQLYLTDGTLTLEWPGGALAASSPLPLDRWVCIEWMVDSISPGMRVWLDGEEVDGLTTFDGSFVTDPPLARFSLGIAYFAYTETFPEVNVWYDEVALDSARIGCSR